MLKSCTISLSLVIALNVAATQPLPTRISSIELERTACLGTCPGYSVTIFSDGRIRYEGKYFVKVIGVRMKVVPASKFNRLVAKVHEIGFFGLEAAYRGTVTDLPTTFVTVTRGGVRKKVEDYMGAPKGLRELEQLIERVAQVSRWVDLDEKAAAAELERAIRSH
jgi:hypothetical protein